MGFAGKILDVKKRHRSVTSRGAALIGGSAALLSGGMVLANGTLFVLGLCGVVLLVIAWVANRLNLRELKIDMHTPHQVAAGALFDWELILFNPRKFFDAFQVQVQVHVIKAETLKCYAPWTASGAASRSVQRMVIPGRRFIEHHHACITSVFPLGLFSNIKKIEMRHELVVTPRAIVPCEISEHGSLHDTLPTNGVSRGQAFGEPHGIRPWQPGDSARHIHWAASARASALGLGVLVREYDPPGFHPDQCYLLFHSYASGREMLREDRFERALSLLAGSLVTLQSRGIPCQVNADFLDWIPMVCSNRSQLAKTLAKLTRVNRSADTEAHDLEQTIQQVSSNETLIVISDMPPESWQHMTGKHPRTMVIDIRQVQYRNKSLQTAI